MIGYTIVLIAGLALISAEEESSNLVRHYHDARESPELDNSPFRGMRYPTPPGRVASLNQQLAERAARRSLHVMNGEADNGYGDERGSGEISNAVSQDSRSEGNSTGEDPSVVKISVWSGLSRIISSKKDEIRTSLKKTGPRSYASPSGAPPGTSTSNAFPFTVACLLLFVSVF